MRCAPSDTDTTLRGCMRPFAEGYPRRSAEQVLIVLEGVTWNSEGRHGRCALTVCPTGMDWSSGFALELIDEREEGAYFRHALQVWSGVVDAALWFMDRGRGSLLLIAAGY